MRNSACWCFWYCWRKWRCWRHVRRMSRWIWLTQGPFRWPNSTSCSNVIRLAYWAFISSGWKIIDWLKEFQTKKVIKLPGHLQFQQLVLDSLGSLWRTSVPAFFWSLSTKKLSFISLTLKSPVSCSKCWNSRIRRHHCQCCNSSSSPSTPREETFSSNDDVSTWS